MQATVYTSTPAVLQTRLGEYLGHVAGSWTVGNLGSQAIRLWGAVNPRQGS